MKRPVFGLFLLMLGLAACKQNGDDAVLYNDKVVELQDAVIQNLINLEESFVDYVPAQMDSAHATFNASVLDASAKIKEMGPYQKDSTLYLAAVNMFDVFSTLAANDYVQFIDLMKVPDSLYTPELQAQSFDLKDAIDKRRTEAQEALITAQEEFAKEHKFILAEPAQ